MKLFAPKYYGEFVCIADKCRHSCCIGWEIDIDDKTKNKYDSLSCIYSKKIAESIDENGDPHFRLDNEERCPHLNASGLCEIIINLGEEYLCDICREHPRFYNETFIGREVGLGMACEEACRIILSSDDYRDIVEIGEDDGEDIYTDFDACTLRSEIYGVLSMSLPYNDRLRILYDRFGIDPMSVDDKKIKKLISSLEYMNEKHRELFLNYSPQIVNASEIDKMSERALAYFVYRHCSGTESYDEFVASLGFCFFCERLLASLACDEKDYFEWARRVSEEIEYSEDNTDAIKNYFLSY